MPETPNYDLPYPVASASDNVPYDLQLLAEAVDTAIEANHVTAGARADALEAVTTDVTAAEVLLTLGNGWTGTVYARKVNGIVYVRGEMLNGTAGATAFTLPVGMRPASKCAFLCPRSTIAAGPAINATVASTGAVDAYVFSGSIPTGSFGINLSSIVFPAA